MKRLLMCGLMAASLQALPLPASAQDEPVVDEPVVDKPVGDEPAAGEPVDQEAVSQSPDDDTSANADTERPSELGSEETSSDVALAEAVGGRVGGEVRDESPAEANVVADERAVAEPAEDQTTGIRGRIVDANTGQGLPDAPVLVQGPAGARTGLTDESGAWLVLTPPGRYTVRSFYDLYHGVRLDRVRVRRGRFSNINLTLDPIDEAEVAVEELEVLYRGDTSSAAAQDQLRAESAGIGEGMGSAQMSQSGAGDASSAASRVVGVSLDGSQLNVRGLGGRYTQVLLNGVAVPSVDPDRPGVDLDLFPTSVVQSLTVSKSFLPNLPGSWAGGLMQINTVSFPEEMTLQVGLGFGVNTLSTFQDQLDYNGGSRDALGFDDGGRAIPSGIDERLQVSRNGAYQSFDAVEQEAERFSNNWTYNRQMGLPRMGLDLTLGNSYSLGENKRLGFLVAAGYGYESVTETGISRPRPTITESGELEAFNDYQLERGRDEVTLSALGTAALELGQNHTLRFLTMYNRSSEDETQLMVGESGELGRGEPVERWQMQFLSRQIWFNQLLGDHNDLFGKRLRLRWSGYASLGERDEPDRRSVTYGPQGGNHRWLEKAGSGERFFSALEQTDFGGTLNLRFPLWSEGWGTVGGRAQMTSRGFVNRRFRMLQDPLNTDQTAYQQSTEELFGAQGIGALTRMREFTRPDDSYTSTQNLYAAFAMVETPIVGPLSLVAGARLEVFGQRVQSQSPFESEESDEVQGTDRLDINVLPAAAFRLKLSDKMNLRAAYGMTVARPQTRELAPYQYYDFLRDRNVQGNPDLERTVIQNADVRWEWFFGEGEILAVSAFYKHFDAPIELQILNPENYDAQFINANAAQNVGGEAEIRLNLSRIAPWLSNFQVGGNLAVLWSQVDLPPELSGAVRAERPLYGQAPYVANLSLSYDNQDVGFTAAAVYNVVGPRISDVGTRVAETILPDIERQPFHSLNLVIGWQVHERLKLGLKVINVLASEQQYTQGDFLTQSINPGTSFRLGVTYSE